MSSSQTIVRITRQSGYQFLVDFGPAMPNLMVDEPPPLGQMAGPSPDQMLMAAVANCLSASLTFALQKFKEDPGPLVAEVKATVERNPQNRLRIARLSVQLQLGVDSTQLPHLERALAQFEEFCTVSMSVRQGIAIDVSVSDSKGARLR
jgi:uncharacterized OsmC-like protein